MKYRFVKTSGPPSTTTPIHVHTQRCRCRTANRAVSTGARTMASPPPTRTISRPTMTAQVSGSSRCGTVPKFHEARLVLVRNAVAGDADLIESPYQVHATPATIATPTSSHAAGSKDRRTPAGSRRNPSAANGATHNNPVGSLTSMATVPASSAEPYATEDRDSRQRRADSTKTTPANVARYSM